MPSRRLSRRILGRLVPVSIPLVAWTLRLLGWTWRIRVEGPDPLAPESVAREGAHLGAVWHRNILIGAAVYRDLGFAVPISRSRDGDLISAVVLRMGWAPPPRGSSSRSASSMLRETIARIGQGTTVAMLCDGPRGPARRAKDGAVAIATATGVPIIPVAFCAAPCLRFPSWDGTLLPWPFARVTVRYGEPIPVPGDLDDDARERYSRALEDRLNTLTDALDADLNPRLALGRPRE